jgi:hypothetical protein
MNPNNNNVENPNNVENENEVREFKSKIITSTKCLEVVSSYVKQYLSNEMAPGMMPPGHPHNTNSIVWELKKILVTMHIFFKGYSTIESIRLNMLQNEQYCKFMSDVEILFKDLNAILDRFYV